MRRVLLVNPPIYDFTAYDFWLRPYGLLRVGGMLRGLAEIGFFDFLDRQANGLRLRSDSWGRGEFPSDRRPSPAALVDIPRRWRRYGLRPETFRDFIAAQAPFDAVLVATGMTYWYEGVREVITDVREVASGAAIALGGVYATLCPDHARTLGADLVIDGGGLDPLWTLLGVAGDVGAAPLWELDRPGRSAVMKLTDGCPFRCTYCAVRRLAPEFRVRPLDRSLAELEMLVARGCRNIAFYDDALLADAENGLQPFLEEVLRREHRLNFHTPNALHARLLTPELARLMVRAGFKTFYLGFESVEDSWQESTGGKVSSEHLARAAATLREAGADMSGVTAYVIVGHPRDSEQKVEGAMREARRLGLRVMLSEFSPIPGTPDGEAARQWVDLDEPLNHNKTAFAIRRLGEGEINRLKALCRELNGSLPSRINA
jgi:molybdenum cofactor biosynthesis enzyme MoaA